MTSDNSTTPQDANALSRRTVAKGIAWAAPAIAVASAAPAFAVSLRKDPGINGWVMNSPSRRSGNCNWRLDVDSTRSGTGPDGAPFGLYLYDIEDEAAIITDASITYWIIGNQNATWSTLTGHSPCWSGPTRIGTATKSDGNVYTGYHWTYTCPIDPSNQQIGADGVRRLWLGHFHVSANFSQPSGLCNNVTYWTQRSITVDRDGPAGRYQPEVLTFERRNGTLGPSFPDINSGRSMQAKTAAVEEIAGEEPQDATS